jgi:hypothetical protein
MADGDEVSIEVTLAVLDRDGSTRGFVACESVQWLFGAGIDTADLSATVKTAEADLADDPDLFDDALVHVLYDGVAAGCPMLVMSDDLAVIGGDDEHDAEAVTLTAKSAVNIASEWQVTPFGGVWLRHSPPVIFFGWQLPGFDDSGWSTPDRVTRASLTPAVYDDTDGTLISGDPKGGFPHNWEYDGADWIYRDPSHGDTGGLTLFRLGTYPVSGSAAQIRVASTADEEHTIYRMGDGGGGVITSESKQETGYTRSRRFDRVQDLGDYFLAAEMTSVDSEGGDGFDALSYYVGPILGPDRVWAIAVLLSSGDSGIKVWRQDKNDPRPGVTVGKIMHLVRDWNQVWMTDPSASCQTVTYSFSTTHDSNGDEFTQLDEMSWNTGTPVTQVMAALSDKADFDCHLDPDDGHLVIDAYNRKGSDLHTSVALVKGGTARDGSPLTYIAKRARRSITRVSGLTDDGYFTKVDGSAEDDFSPRSTYIESQQSPSIGQAKRLSGRLIDDDGRRQSFTATLAPVEGAIPGRDCDWGDNIEALGRDGLPREVVLISWGGSRTGDDEPVLTAEVI